MQKHMPWLSQALVLGAVRFVLLTVGLFLSAPKKLGRF
jgi:hypothetical protein